MINPTKKEKREKGRKRNIRNRLAICRDILQADPDVTLHGLSNKLYGNNCTRREIEKTSAMRSIARRQITS